MNAPISSQIIPALLLLACLASSANAAADQVDSWIGAQANLHSWSAEFVQTRTLKTLAAPLKTNGRLWYQAPNRFRWELGDPAQTIALHHSNEMLVIYPRLKRVERYAQGREQTGPWSDTLALLQAGFPSSRAEFDRQYRILSQSGSSDLLELLLEPRSAASRRMIPRIKITLAAGTFELRATELSFADGSTLRNDFNSPEANPKIDENLFRAEIPPDYKTIDPLKGP
jgi:outer membrane lipoprotein-sorting protein